MPAASRIQASPCAEGHLVRIEGRGDMHRSVAFHRYAVRSLESSPSSVIVDLSACEYLDSTFLGCLVGIHRRFNQESERFVVAEPSEALRGLLASMNLDKLLAIRGECPQPAAAYATLDTESDAETLSRHVYECHRDLAETNERNRAVFGPIANQMERELGPPGDTDIHRAI